MNGDGSKQRYVSTFRMNIRPSGISVTGSRPNGTRAPDKCPDAGKGGMRGRGWINNNKVCIVLDSVQVVAFVMLFFFF